MLSHLVTAARGLFARQNSGAEEDSPHSQDQTTNPIPLNTPPEMVSGTRRTVFPVTTEKVNSPSATKGKRKTAPSKQATESQTAKRRKQRGSNNITSPVAEPVDEGGNVVKKLPFRAADSSDVVYAETQPREEKSDTSNRASNDRDEVATGSNTRATHVRFGNEDPSPEFNSHSQHEQVTEDAMTKESRDSEDSDDDEAPETVDNAAQLRKIKEASRKEAQAKQKTDAVNREKRRERDQRLKAQAASKPAPPNKSHAPSIPQDRCAKQDDILSESSATLQGSISKPFRSLPTLLPDEILNAEPSSDHSRLPAPSYEIESPLVGKMSMSKKRKFLDKAEKKPKDIRIGGTSIRVLESSGGSGRDGICLPPKSSKGSRRVRESLVAGNRTLLGGGSLRRTTGGSSGFVRK
ncbi:hypothetical protein AJ78_02717 [Emergomyces pasteurianus Ep9510]|uniref:Immediate-early protein n=1 Tax=Emergomyces pasteurianus Ep9510 TaxID=1447872 RepID=A0A1J9QPJ1_9EURO|nr:hypothetical protein AJ78_02717 [Emergomyces pasteurianus Ep9510]